MANAANKSVSVFDFVFFCHQVARVDPKKQGDYWKGYSHKVVFRSVRYGTRDPDIGLVRSPLNVYPGSQRSMYIQGNVYSFKGGFRKPSCSC